MKNEHLLVYWRAALKEEYGIVIEDLKWAKSTEARLYEARASAGDPSLDGLTIRCLSETSLIIRKKLVDQLT